MWNRIPALAAGQALLAGILGMLPLPADASPVVFAFSGEFGFVGGDSPDPSIPTNCATCPYPGLSFRGTLTLDTDTQIPISPVQSSQRYRHQALPAGLRIEVGDIVIESDPDHVSLVVSVNDDYDQGFGPIDSVIVLAENLVSTTGHQIEPISISFVGRPDAYDLPYLPTSVSDLPTTSVSSGNTYLPEIYVLGCVDSPNPVYCTRDAMGVFSLNGRLRTIETVPEPSIAGHLVTSVLGLSLLLAASRNRRDPRRVFTTWADAGQDRRA